MKQAFQRLPYKWLFLTIVGLFLVVSFLPYITFLTFEYDNDYVFVEHVIYGWEWPSFQIYIAFAIIILGCSLSPREFVRITLVKLIFILMIPIGSHRIFSDFSQIWAQEYQPIQHPGIYLSYLGLLLTFTYAILNSYPSKSTYI